MKWFARLAVFFLACSPLSAPCAPVGPDVALRAVSVWLDLEENLLDARRGAVASGAVTARTDAAGTTLYYAVALSPIGFVLAGADDAIEPILAYSPSGSYNDDPESPLVSLASTDAAARVEAVRRGAALTDSTGVPGTSDAVGAKSKWELLLAAGGRQGALPRQSQAAISSVLVSPFLETKWGQDNDDAGTPTYNLYTPTVTATGAHTLTGCVATAMAQVMRYYQFPTGSVGTTSYPIKLCQLCSGSTPSQCAATTMATRGGNGTGGPYDFQAMALVPDASTSAASRQAISALMADAGATVRMDYATCFSGAYQWYAAAAFKSVFGYSNAVWNSGGPQAQYSMTASQYRNILNANLDATLPVLVTISNADSGHEVVADGYGYNVYTLYHHLNMGWNGQSDVWYNLPIVDAGGVPFTTVWTLIYNLYTSGTGEIVSGRVTNSAAALVSGVAVTATGPGGVTYTVTSNANGIFAFLGLPSNTTFALTAYKSGFRFAPLSVATGTSKSPTGDDSGNITNYENNQCGNVWGADFVGVRAPVSITPTYLLLQ